MQRRTFITTAVAVGVAAQPVQPEAQSPEPPMQGFLVKAGEGRFGEKTKLFGITPNDIKVSGKDTNGSLSVFAFDGREKGGPPLHTNPNQDEIFYVVEGSYLFEMGGERYTLTTGDLIFAPRNVPHTFAQLTDTGRMVFFVQPSGTMEDYFRTLGTLTGKLSPPEGAKLFAKHGMQIVGPPIELK